MHLLLNWLLQTAALVLAVHVVLRRWRTASAATRHAVWFMTLVLLTALPLRDLVESALVTEAPPMPLETAEPLAAFVLPPAPAWMTLLAICLWGEWAALSLVRLARAIAALADARQTCTPFPADREARLTHWRRLRASGRPAALALCPRVGAAAVFGLRRPLIAVSPVLASRLTDDELDQVIVHELAHVRRRDDFATLAQACVSALVGFHPAVRLALSRLALEREMACDDWVVRATGSARQYASCLTRVAEARDFGPRLAPAALNGPQLRVRVHHLLDARRSRARASRLSLAASACLLLALALLITGTAIVVESRERPFEPRLITAAANGHSADSRGSRSAARAGTPSPARADVSHATLAEDEAPRIPSLLPSPPQDTLTHTAARQPDTQPASRPQSQTDRTGASPGRPLDARTLHAFEQLPLGADPQSDAADPVDQSDEDGTIPARLVSPWQSLAGAGIVVGEGTQRAAIAVAESTTHAATATAGFMTRMGKSFTRIF